MYQIQETACSYESRVYYIHFPRDRLGMEQRFLYKSYFVFLYSDATCN